MSIGNIISIEPVLVLGLPVGVTVTFSCNHGKEQRSYFYDVLDAVKGILAGDDPAAWGSGVRVDGSSGSAGSAGGIGGAIGEISDIGEIL